MTPFKEKVLNFVSMVPAGNVVSYGQVAAMIGVPRASRAVGGVLHEFGDKYPWWRVISSSGRISTKCEEHTALMQKDLLQKEGVVVGKNLTVDIEKFRFIPSLNELKNLSLSQEDIEYILGKYF